MAIQNWSDDITVLAQWESEKHTSFTHHLERTLFARKFQIRVTDMDSNIRIRSITPSVSQGAQHELAI